MSDTQENASIGLLLSGGLDSCILLGHLAAEKRRVQPFYIRSQLRWEEEELRAAQAFLQAVGKNIGNKIERLVVLDMPLKDIYGRHWSTDGQDITDARSPDDAVYLPGRNALLIIKASIWCRLNGIDQLLWPCWARIHLATRPPSFSPISSPH